MRHSVIAGEKWRMAKIIIACICFGMFIYMLITAYNLINLNDNKSEGREITPSNYGTLLIGEKVYGTISHDNFLTEYQGNNNDMCYYLLRGESDVLLTFRTRNGSKFDEHVKRVMSGEENSVEFRGIVSKLSDTSIGILNMEVIASRLLNNNGIEGGLRKHLIMQAVDINAAELGVTPNMIIATFVGAGIMLLLTWFFLKKIILEIIYSVKERKGEIVHEEPKLDIETGTEKSFDGGLNDAGYFYIGHDWDDELKNANNNGENNSDEKPKNKENNKNNFDILN